MKRLFKGLCLCVLAWICLLYSGALASGQRGSQTVWILQSDGEIPTITKYLFSATQAPQIVESFAFPHISRQTLPETPYATNPAQPPKQALGSFHLSPDQKYLAHCLEWGNKIEVFEITSQRRIASLDASLVRWKAPHTLVYMERVLEFEVCSWDITEPRNTEERTCAKPDAREEKRTAAKERIAQTLTKMGHLPPIKLEVILDMELHAQDIPALSEREDKALVSVFPKGDVSLASMYLMVTKSKVIGTIPIPEGQGLRSPKIVGNWLMAVRITTEPTPKKEMVIWQIQPWAQKYTIPAVDIVQ